MLALFISETEFTNWDRNIPAVVFAHNTSINATLKEIPFFLMFGRYPVLPMDLALNLPTSSLTADDMLNRLEKAFSRSRSNLVHTQQDMSHRFNRNRSTHDFKVGDLVLYRIPTRKKGQPDKLQPKARGPYLVTEVLSDSSCVICLVDDPKSVQQKVSVRLLNLFKRAPEKPFVSEHKDTIPNNGETASGSSIDNNFPNTSPVDPCPEKVLRRSKRLLGGK